MRPVRPVPLVRLEPPVRLEPLVRLEPPVPLGAPGIGGAPGIRGAPGAGGPGAAAGVGAAGAGAGAAAGAESAGRAAAASAGPTTLHSRYMGFTTANHCATFFTGWALRLVMCKSPRLEIGTEVSSALFTGAVGKQALIALSNSNQLTRPFDIA